jgi:hypothetical protein
MLRLLPVVLFELSLSFLAPYQIITTKAVSKEWKRLCDCENWCRRMSIITLQRIGYNDVDLLRNKIAAMYHQHGLYKSVLKACHIINGATYEIEEKTECDVVNSPLVHTPVNETKWYTTKRFEIERTNEDGSAMFSYFDQCSCVHVISFLKVYKVFEMSCSHKVCELVQLHTKNLNGPPLHIRIVVVNGKSAIDCFVFERDPIRFNPTKPFIGKWNVLFQLNWRYVGLPMNYPYNLPFEFVKQAPKILK